MALPLSMFKQDLTPKGKLIIAFLILVIVAGGGVVAFKFYDFTQNNPKFCVSCHLMQPAYDAWAESEHKDVNCHDCHHLTIPEQNRLLVNFVLHRPDKVPERHGKVIVPWKYCASCHWETDDRYPEAKKVNRSWGHAKHVFMEQIECARCHGYITHRFTAEERFCVRCHEGKEVHGVGMEGLACLNCHTDRTHDIRPDRAKCLFCHGGEKYAKILKEGDTLDVRHHEPDPGLVEGATKIVLSDDAPMQFDCYKCHHPHTKARPDWSGCITCHPKIPNTGQHGLHIETMGLNCSNCHEPHVWRVTKAKAKKKCTQCHEYRDPLRFLQ